MIDLDVSRKERRKASARHAANYKIVKGTTFVGSALLVSSIAAPIMLHPTTMVEATEFQQAATQASPSNFIAQIAPYAQAVASQNDLYASVMMAQAIVESGWGTSTLSCAPNYNLFGIKGSYNGQTVYMNTQEYLNGQWVVKNEPFRKYPSYMESFYDNAYVLRNTSFQSGVYYYAGAWKSNTYSYRDATAYLTGRYATAPNYATALNNVIEAYGLTAYDTPASGTPGGMGGGTVGDSGSVSTGGSDTSSATDQYYTVQSGDSVWLISNKFGISIATLKSWNGMTSDLIHPGQKLIVKKGSGSTSTGNSSSTGSTNNTSNNTNTSTSGDQRYTVQSGDSVWLISNKFGISIATLKSWNNMTSDLIHPGQSLIVKKGSGSTSTGNSGSTGSTNNTSSNTSTSTSGDQRYTVQSGDSVWLISNKFGISIATLKSWNNMTSDLIHPGQSLIVKKGSGSTSTGNNGSTGSTNNTSNNTNTSTSGGQRYTVQSGDSVWLISNKFGISIATLKSMNGMTSDLIHPGQSLIVKQGSGATSNAGSTNTNNTPSSSGKTYKVVSGDTLWDIAQKYGTSIQKIKSLNGLSGDVIFIGQQLKVG